MMETWTEDPERAPAGTRAQLRRHAGVLSIAWLVVAACGSPSGTAGVRDNSAPSASDPSARAVRVECERGPGTRGRGMGPGMGGPGMGGPGMGRGGPGAGGPCMGQGSGSGAGSACMGPGGGMGGPGMGGPGMMREDMARIHQLLGGHDQIARKVVEIPDGIESWTTSSDPALAAALPAHVDAMVGRMKTGQLVHGFDPLFRKVFANAGAIEVTVEPIAGGVHVIERGKTPAAVAVIRAHAQVVDWFQQLGFAEAHRCHDVAP